VLIEKYLAGARHIEVQVFGDAHGNVVSLFERECTLQRRHQKMIEEAPAPTLTPERRAAMAAAARAAAQAVNYVNAGTVEFVADAGAFYFIEMNTRLQVEHPVTEAITGLDLVEWQLRVASGEKLPLAQDAIRAQGHAIEARIYAEDAARGFLPATGIIRTWPALSGEGIRVDSGFRAGDRVSPYYDALLAKLIVHGTDRAQALARMNEALAQFRVEGITTNVAFLKALVDDPQVRRGEVDTGFIERELERLVHGGALAPRDLAAACAAVICRAWAEETGMDDSPWSRRDGWTLGRARQQPIALRQGEKRLAAAVIYGRDGLKVEIDGAAQPLAFAAGEGDALTVRVGGDSERVVARGSGRDLELVTPRGRFALHLVDPFAGERGAAAAESRIVAPMPGTVTRILAEPGSQVARGAPLIVMEAMKMEHTLRAPADGLLKAIRCAVGDVVQEGAELADFEAAETE
jgi:3-methylcrotonyl-CoA carboxylase alpha subunit